MNIGLGIGIPFSRSILYRALSTSLYLDFVSNETLDPKISFSRASNATVTKSDGTIGYAPHNLLTYSEQFDNTAWTKSKSTVVSNVVAAPNGSLSADKLVENSETGAHASYPANYSATNVTLTASIYAKASERSSVLLEISNFLSGSAVCRFNLSSGTFTTPSSTTTDYTGISASIASVGNGWFRCSITATKGSANSNNFVVINIDNGSTNLYTGDGTSGIYIWGAQLNVGALQPYYPTTVKNLLGYTQEFDNAAWTKSNSFVQTNLLTYSQELDNTAWTAGTGTVTANSQIAPDGSLTADTCTTTGTTAQSIYQSVTVSAATSYTFSFYVRLGSLAASNFTIAVYNNTAASFIAADVIPTQTPTTSEWTRISYVFTTPVGCTSVRVYPFRFGSAIASSTFYLWGAQLVQGSTPGDYVATYGTTRAVMYTAPDGTMTADKLVEDATTIGHFVQPNPPPSFTAGQTVTYSIYAKAAERSFMQLVQTGIGPGSTNLIAGFDLLNGTTGTPTAGTTSLIVPIGNGWYRCSFTTPITTTTASTAQIRIALNSTSSPATYTGDGTSGIYIWGAQLSDSASLDPYVYNPGAAPAASAYYGPRFDYDPVTLQPKGLLIEEQRTNLLTYSEQFDNAAWAKATAGVSANQQVAPDGTTTSDRFVPSAGLSSPALTSAFLAALGNTYTFSVYVKQDSANKFLMLQFDGDIWNSISSAERPRIWFDPTSGQITSSQRVTNSGVAVLSDGWFRVFMSAYCSTGASTNARVAMQSSSASTAGYTGDGTSGIYIWGAQLEAGAFPTSYIPTTAAAATRAADGALMTGANFSSWYRQDEGTLFGEGDVIAATNDAVLASVNGGTTVDDTRLRVLSTSNNLGFRVFSSGVSQASLFQASAFIVGQVFKLAGAYKQNDFAFSAGGNTAATDTSGAVSTATQFSLGGIGSTSILNGHIRRIAYYPRRLSNAELQGITA